MSAPPRLTIGLPVYNGEKYVSESIEALLGQSFADFELIISDNASTDTTGDICRRYEKQDSRVRYFRQPRNIGLSPNHNFLVEQARGELFKWASYDDLYARDLLERCVDALDKYPEIVLAHCWTAKIDDLERFRSLLFDDGGDDDYGVIRTEVSAGRRCRGATIMRIAPSSRNWACMARSTRFLIGCTSGASTRGRTALCQRGADA